MDQNNTPEKKQSAYLTGKVLLAMPSMGDARFHKAVIFICAHDENGAMGLVVNQEVPGLDFDDLLSQLKIVSDISLDFSSLSFPVMNGGPVEGSRGFLLHSSDFAQQDTIPVGAGFSVTGTIDALKEIASGRGPQNMLFILGYAGWSAGQLDHEIQDNAWLVMDPDPALIFHVAPEEKWTRAIKKLGIDPVMLSTTAGHA